MIGRDTELSALVAQAYGGFELGGIEQLGSEHFMDSLTHELFLSGEGRHLDIGSLMISDSVEVPTVNFFNPEEQPDRNGQELLFLAPRNARIYTERWSEAHDTRLRLETASPLRKYGLWALRFAKNLDHYPQVLPAVIHLDFSDKQHLIVDSERLQKLLKDL